MDKVSYLIPDLKVFLVAIERGFGSSNQEFIEGEKDPQDW